MKSRLGRTPPANPRATSTRRPIIRHSRRKPAAQGDEDGTQRKKTLISGRWNDEFTGPSAKQAKAAKKRDVSLVQLIVNFRPAFRRS